MLEVKAPRWSEQDRAASAAFRAACQGPDPDVTALDGLAALLALARDARLDSATPADTYVSRIRTIRKCRALLDGLRAAVAQSEGADDE